MWFGRDTRPGQARWSAPVRCSTASATRWGSRPAYWTQLALGVGLFLLSFRFDPKRRAAKGKSPTANWTERVQRATGATRTLTTLALTAGLLEVATMFPYLGAIALVALSERITPLLTKVNNWFEKHAIGATGWIPAIVGFLVARDAAFQLGLFDQWVKD